MSTDLGTAGEMESRELVHFVTQQTRFALINNILQHPEQLPSMYELEELNPSVSEATVYKHIQKLIDAGIVKEVALDDDQRRQDIPGSSTASQRRAGPSSTNTISSPRRKPSNRSTRPSLTSPRRWSSTKIPLARTTRNPYRISFVSVLDHRSILYSPASFWNSDHARSRSSSTSPCVSRYWSSASITSSSPYFTACSRGSSSSTSTWLSRRRQYERWRLPSSINSV